MLTKIAFLCPTFGDRRGRMGLLFWTYGTHEVIIVLAEYARSFDHRHSKDAIMCVYACDRCLH